MVEKNLAEPDLIPVPEDEGYIETYGADYVRDVG